MRFSTLYIYSPDIRSPRLTSPACCVLPGDLKVSAALCLSFSTCQKIMFCAVLWWWCVWCMHACLQMCAPSVNGVETRGGDQPSSITLAPYFPEMDSLSLNLEGLTLSTPSELGLHMRDHSWLVWALRIKLSFSCLHQSILTH